MTKQSKLIERQKSRGLVIRAPWIDLILAGEKVWEIRGTTVNIRGRVRLIQSGTGLVVGEVDIVDCKGPFSMDQLKRLEENHRVPSQVLEEWGGYAQNFAWVLRNPVRYTKPKKYRHPPGAVIWVSAEHLP